MDKFEESLLLLNDKEVRNHLDSDQPPNVKEKKWPDVLCGVWTNYGWSELSKATGRRDVIYMLRNAGLYINYQNEEGDTLLHCVLRYNPEDSETCEALLQSGSDMWLRNKEGFSAVDYANRNAQNSAATQEVVRKYKPGLWKAVCDDDLMAVRRLINLWCRVDLYQDGKSLKELALDKGTEHIIRLIIEIQPAMTLAHCVLARDVTRLIEISHNTKPAINTEFRNLGDMGATALFYAIMANSLELVRILRSMDAKVDTVINFEDEDIAILFAGLTRETDPELIKCLIPKREDQVAVASMHCRGRNILLHSIENDVSPGAVRFLLKQGYPELVAMRDQRDRCPRELAECLGKTAYVTLIDEVVHDWYLDCDGWCRQTLALMGYTYLQQAEKNDIRAHEVVSSMETSSEQAKFDTTLDDYQDHIDRLHRAVESGDVTLTRSLLQYASKHSRCFRACLANSRARGDGQPLLHKAVLRSPLQVVHLVAHQLVEKCHVKLDDDRDAWCRTPLHYAYGRRDAKDVINLLLDLGASEFTLDKDARSPLVFREHRDDPRMARLIEYHTKQLFLEPEPNPFSIHGRIKNLHRRQNVGSSRPHGNTDYGQTTREQDGGQFEESLTSQSPRQPSTTSRVQGSVAMQANTICTYL